MNTQPVFDEICKDAYGAEEILPAFPAELKADALKKIANTPALLVKIMPDSLLGQDIQQYLNDTAQIVKIERTLKKSGNLTFFKPDAAAPTSPSQETHHPFESCIIM